MPGKRRIPDSMKSGLELVIKSDGSALCGWKASAKT